MKPTYYVDIEKYCLDPASWRKSYIHKDFSYKGGKYKNFTGLAIIPRNGNPRFAFKGLILENVCNYLDFERYLNLKSFW